MIFDTIKFTWQTFSKNKRSNNTQEIEPNDILFLLSVIELDVNQLLYNMEKHIKGWNLISFCFAEKLYTLSQ